MRQLAEELQRRGHRASHQVVADLLQGMDYSLQANRKTLEGRQYPDRNAQFDYINRKVHRRLTRGEPLISVNTKKKELVGDFKNGGREWRPQGEPKKVRMHDFARKRILRLKVASSDKGS